MPMAGFRIYFPGQVLIPGTYQMQFDTGRYFLDTGSGFYPEVGIQFMVRDGSHYHVPLLINPFGYSTLGAVDGLCTDVAVCDATAAELCIIDDKMNIL